MGRKLANTTPFIILGVCDGFHHTGPGYLLPDPDAGVCLYVHQRRQLGRTFGSQENTAAHAKTCEGKAPFTPTGNASIIVSMSQQHRKNDLLGDLLRTF